MQVLQTTLLTGPYDWDPALLPRAEFEARLARVRTAMAAAGADALLVQGGAGDYGGLAYLTGFTPKLDRAVALVPRAGALRVLAQGTELMLPWARRLTWVEDVRVLANIAVILEEWLPAQGLGRDATLAVWGEAGMPRALHAGIARALAPQGRLVSLDAPLDAIRLRKTPLELGLVKRAAAILDATAASFLAAARAGAGNRAAALAAERTAYAHGAQDARVATSLSPGGPPLPLDGARDDRLAPLLATLAVQFAGYWAEGAVTAGAEEGAASARARAALAAALDAARPDAGAPALLRAATAALAPCRPHRLMQGRIGHAIGLSLEEQPLVADADRLERRGVYVLAVGAQGKGADAAVASAMIAVTEAGIETLWRGGA
ncbi:MAG TPA: aminopeptidase P family N-terminal domain-containing protein [Stellaceae bacterium]|nr:aminopeptidase P family N-terminal domain-containing protein [Stellaceae bacterium]